MNLTEQLAQAEATVRHLKKSLNGATCAQAGHDWHSIGGRNCGCFGGNGGCSLAVMECRRCGDSDYGDTPENEDEIQRCYRLAATTPSPTEDGDSHGSGVRAQEELVSLVEAEVVGLITVDDPDEESAMTKLYEPLSIPVKHP